MTDKAALHRLWSNEYEARLKKLRSLARPPVMLSPHGRLEKEEKPMIEYGEWEIWNGNGEPPKCKVQVQFYDETRADAEERKPKEMEPLWWKWDLRDHTSHIIAFRRVKEPVKKMTPIKLWVSDRDNMGMFPTKDGHLIPGTYTSEAGDKIVITASPLVLEDE